MLINRAALLATLGGDKAPPDALDKQIKEIQGLVASAAGLNKERGDEAKISVVDFVDAGKDLEPVNGPSFLEILERQTGTLVNAGAIILVAALLIWFGVRPATKALLAPPPESLIAAEAAGGDAGALEFGSEEPQIAIANGMGEGEMPMGMGMGGMYIQSNDETDQIVESLTERRDRGPATKLQKLVDFDEEHAATILKQWIREGAGA